MNLTQTELKALKRFQECCEDPDSGGHDVPDEMMKRLSVIGLVRSIGFGRHTTTEYGEWVLALPSSGEPEPSRPVAYANHHELTELQDCNHALLGLDSPRCWPIGQGESKPYPWLVPLFAGTPTQLVTPASPELHAAVGSIIKTMAERVAPVMLDTALRDVCAAGGRIEFDPEMLLALNAAYVAAPGPITVESLSNLQRYGGNRYGGLDASERGSAWLARDVLALFDRLPGETETALSKLPDCNSGSPLQDAIMLPLYPRDVDEPEIQAIIEAAADLATKHLDQLFPNTPPERGGISSNFQGLLMEHLTAMLTGREASRKSYARSLTPLFGDWRTFGRPPVAGTQEGFTFLAIPASPDEAQLFYDDDQKKLVSLAELNVGALFTSGELATKACFEWLRAEGLNPREKTLSLCLLSFANEGPPTVARIAEH